MSNATYALTITGTHYNQFLETVMHFQGDLAVGTDTLTEGRDLIEAFRSQCEDDWLACLPPTFTLDRYVTACVLPAGSNGNAHLQMVNAGKIGTSGTAAASENLCPVVNLIPPMGIKSQGRVYMPCIAKEDIDNNIIQAGYRAATTTVFTEFRTGMVNSATRWKMAIYSKKNGTSSLMQSFSLSAAIGFQGRRRRPL